MKKLFYFIPFLFISNIYADTFTPLPVGLTQPTTGAIDLKKSWAQKLNENFQAISTYTNATILTANNSNYVTITGAGIMQGGLGAKVVYSTNMADNTILGTNLGYQIILSSHIGANTIQGANISSATTLSVASMTVYAIFTATTGFIGGNSTITILNVSNLATVSSMTVYAIFTDTTGTILGGSTITILNVNQLATISSMTVYGTITSSTGFVGGSSTFTTLNVTGIGGATFSTMTSFSIITSTTGFIGGSSTFTALNVTGIGGATFSSMTAFGTITSSVGFRGGSSTFSAVVVQTTITLPNSGATAGTYTNTNLTVNAAGLIVAAANGSSGGGGGVTLSTHTIDLSVDGDVTTGTGTFSPLNRVWYNDRVSTWTITLAEAYTAVPSTITHQFSVMYSTGGTNPGGIYTPIDASSFTILPNQANSTSTIIPGAVTSLVPGSYLSLWCTFAASTATAITGGSGVKLRAWKNP